jgi:hypothetical protein
VEATILHIWNEWDLTWSFSYGLQVHCSRRCYNIYLDILTLNTTIKTVLLFNIITGLMVDGFGSLREDDNIRTDILENYCFVCGNLLRAVLKSIIKTVTVHHYHLLFVIEYL